MTKTRAPRRPVVLLRPVPGTSTIHELWAGTKLIAVFLISVLLTFFPTWTAIGAVAALVILTAWLAHIPRGAVPTIPIWMVALVIGGSLTVFFSGGPPFWHIGGSPSDFTVCSRWPARRRSPRCCWARAPWCRGRQMSPRSRPPWPCWGGP